MRGREARIFALVWLGVVLVFWFGLFVPNMDPSVRRPLEDMDLYGYFLPKLWYGNEALAEGRLPLWNPYEYAGLPLLAAAQPAALYPVKILVFALVPVLALHVFMLLHYFLAGIICFVALAGLGLGWPGATLGTITWVFSAINMDSHYHVIRLACLTWVPLVFLFFVRTLERPGPRSAAGLAAAAALTVLAGYPEYALDTGVALAVFWPLAAWSGGVRSPDLPRAVAWLAASALVVAALTALQLLPLAEMVRQSVRLTTQPLTMDVLAFWGWNFLHDLQALRYVLGRVGHMFHMAPFAWMLVLVGIVLGRGRFRLPFAVLFFLMVGFSTVLGRALRSVPGFGLFRPGYCWISLAYLPAAYLAGFGLEAVLAGLPAEGSRARRGIGLALVALALAASAIFLAPRSWPGLAVSVACVVAARLRHAWRAPALVAMAGTVLLSIWAWNPPVFAVPVLHRYARKETPYPRSPPRASGLGAELQRLCGGERWRVLAPERMWDGTPIVDRIEMLQGYPESLAPARMWHLLHTTGLEAERGPSLDARRLSASAALLDLLNVGCVVAPLGATVDPAATGLVPVGRTGRGEAVFRRPSALPRAFMVGRATAVPDGEAAWQAVTRPGFEPAREAVVEGTAAAPPGGAGTVRIERWEPEALTLAVSAPGPGLVVVSQAFFPGWQALIDGRRAPLYRADYVLMALAVPAGDHEVVVRYRPASVRIGAMAFGLGLVALVGLALTGRERR